jgi:probable HAF family extracellular repeat protein
MKLVKAFCGFAAMLSIAVPASPAAGQCRYQVHVISGPDCSIFNVGISVRGMNRDRIVVGWMRCPEDDNDTAFVAEDDLVAVPIEFPWPVLSSRAYDISDCGDIVGTVTRPEFGNRAFIQHANGETIDLGTMPGGTTSEALGVNANGDIAGYWANVVTGPVRAFVWFGGEMVDIGPDVGINDSHAEDINAIGQVTGWQGPAGGVQRRAFLWHDGSSIDLAAIAGGADSWGYAVNGRGHVVGRASNRAALWQDGAYVDLGVLPGTSSTFARDINALTQVVGHAGFASPAFLWQKGAMYDLNELAQLPDDVVLGTGYAINDAGDIACKATWIGPPSTGISVVLTPIDRPRTDVDGDCVTNADDLQQVLGAWGTDDSLVDIDGSGVVALGDLLLVLSSWDVVQELPPEAVTEAIAGSSPSMAEADRPLGVHR